MKKAIQVAGILVLAVLLSTTFVAIAVPKTQIDEKTQTKNVSSILPKLVATDIIPRGTTESRVIQSAHPYTNNYDYTWTVTKAGATRIRIHFVKIDTESSYDFVYTYQGSTQLNRYTGLYSSGVWSSWATGDTIKVRLKTDYSVTKWGFQTDLIEYEVAQTAQPLTNGVTATGSLTGTGDSDMWYIDVNSGATSMRSVLTCPSGSDFDLYGKLGSAPTTSTYDWRGYTSGGEDVTFNNPGAGRWYVMPYSYSGSGSYQLTVTVTYGGGGGDGVVRKYAVIVGISDYKAINDLSYCDEDASDWYNQLVNTLGWSSSNVMVYGDGHTANYPKYDGIANEYNVKQALNWLMSTADGDDIIAFISSGHGSGNGAGSSYLCMWDCSSGESGQDGNLYDTELQSILQTAVAGKIFVFLDHCFSGGFGPELMGMANSAHVYLTTTCTQNGYGYDDSTHLNGAWTYYFLQYTWIGHYGGTSSTAMENVFSYALGVYPYSGGDTPQQYDGNTSAYFYLQ